MSVTCELGDCTFTVGWVNKHFESCSIWRYCAEYNYIIIIILTATSEISFSYTIMSLFFWGPQYFGGPFFQCWWQKLLVTHTLPYPGHHPKPPPPPPPPPPLGRVSYQSIYCVCSQTNLQNSRGVWLRIFMWLLAVIYDKQSAYKFIYHSYVWHSRGWKMVPLLSWDEKSRLSFI